MADKEYPPAPPINRMVDPSPPYEVTQLERAKHQRDLGNEWVQKEIGLSAADKEARVKTLGASEIAMVAGVHPYRNALDVYLSKVGLAPVVEESDELRGYSEWGHRLEAVIAQKYADVHGASLLVGERTIHPTEKWMSATPDRLVIADWNDKFASPDRIERGLELKNRNAHVATEFGEMGSDIVPFDIAAQCHWSMEVTGLTTWDVAVLIGGNFWSWFRIHRDQEIIDSLKDRGYDFWHNNVLARVEPSIDGSESWKQYITKKFAKHTEVLKEGVMADFYMLADLVEVKEQLKALEQQKTQLENTLKNAVGDAAGIAWPNGAKFTWKRTKDSTATVVDYEAIATDLATEFKVPLEALNELREMHTKTIITREGVRKIHISVPKEKK